jgi:hypothetical protein
MKNNLLTLNEAVETGETLAAAVETVRVLAQRKRMGIEVTPLKDMNYIGRQTVAIDGDFDVALTAN